MGFQHGNNNIQSQKRQRVTLKITQQIIADTRGVTKAAVRKAVERGKLNMHDLKSIAEYILE